CGRNARGLLLRLGVDARRGLAQSRFAAGLGILAVDRRATAPGAGRGRLRGGVRVGRPGGAAPSTSAARATRRRDAGGSADHLTRLVQEQRGGGRATDLVDAHHPLFTNARGRAGDRDDVAVDFGDRVVHVVHVWLDDLHQHLVALAERQGALLDLLARADEGDREMVEGEAFGALEQEGLAGLRLEGGKHAGVVPGELGADARVDLHEEALGLGMPDGHVAQLALELDRDRLLRADHALALARRTGAAHDLAHALGHVLARHLDEAEL